MALGSGADKDFEKAKRGELLIAINRGNYSSSEEIAKTLDLNPYSAEAIEARLKEVEEDLRLKKTNIEEVYLLQSMVEETDLMIPLHHATRLNHLDIMKLLLDLKIDPNKRRFPDGATALHVAAQKGHVQALKLLIDQRANVEAVTVADSTPLHVAVYANQLSAAKCLVERGANVNARRADTVTPLFLAIAARNLPMAEMLLTAGAAIEGNAITIAAQIAIKTKMSTELDLLFTNGANIEDGIVSAKKEGREEIEEYLLALKGAKAAKGGATTFAAYSAAGGAGADTGRAYIYRKT